MTRKPNILIVSIENDIHALAVEKTIKDSFDASVSLLCVDRLSDKSNMFWDPQNLDATKFVDYRGNEVDVALFDAIWWRRSRASQILNMQYANEAHVDVINNDWRSSLRGALVTSHRGAWISHPDATELASNKLWQLKVVASLGFKIPRTIVTNNLNNIRHFAESLKSEIIIKPVVGTKLELLFTQIVPVDELDEDSVSVAPAFYQEYIPGTTHLRVNVFGDSIYAVALETSDLDWRPNLNVPVTPYNVDSDLKSQLRKSLDYLGLEMGIVDLKITPAGEPIWLEVNPQGQFLFLDGLTKQDLLGKFSRYLVDCARCRTTRHLELGSRRALATARAS